MAEAAIAAAGSIIKGVGSYEAGRYNRKSAYADARNAEQQGSDQAQIIQRQARAAIGAQSAAQGESGFQQGSGSALDAITQSQTFATLDAMTARYNAEMTARQRRQQGDIAYAQGKNALVQSIISGGASAAGSVDWASSGPGGSATPASPSSSGISTATSDYNVLAGL